MQLYAHGVCGEKSDVVDVRRGSASRSPIQLAASISFISSPISFIPRKFSFTDRGLNVKLNQRPCAPANAMNPQNLNCPNCGAAISSDSPRCQYCESKLATVACASCFGMMFLGSKHCPHCGAAAVDATSAELSVLKCPRCKIAMSSVKIGGEAMRECERCGGLWLDVATLDRICANREEQSAMLGGASLTPAHHLELNADALRISYVPCPQCGQLMNRINFARCTGVIVDVCKGHGSWF